MRLDLDKHPRPSLLQVQLRENRVISKVARAMIAYHEAGPYIVEKWSSVMPVCSQK